MALLDFLFGSKDKLKKENILSREQNEALAAILGQIRPEQFSLTGSPLYQSGQSYLQNLLSGNPGAFQAFEKPYLNQFEQEIVPGIAERFTGNFGGNRSSGFRQSVLGAGSNLSAQLAALRENLKSGAATQGLQYSQQPFENTLALSRLGLGTQAYQPYVQQGSTGLIPGLSTQIASGFGQGLGGYLAGGPGGAGSSLFGGLRGRG